MTQIVLASQSSGRAATPCSAAGPQFEATAAHVDEEALIGWSRCRRPDGGVLIADALAEAKAIKISSRLPGVAVIGADLTLALADGTMLAKPEALMRQQTICAAW